MGERAAIAIVDYGMGNLRSVQKGFESVGAEATISHDAKEIAAAGKVVLPGVGAFEDAMREIKRRELDGVIREAVAAGRPFLGICLGLQLLFETSYEDGEHEGLGILQGTVERFEAAEGRKVPHMGWNRMAVQRRAPILAGVEDDAHFYFVHSYYVCPTDAEVTAGVTEYGHEFTSMVWRDNLFATQFHPEKSQTTGLKLLANFAALDD